MIKVISSQNRVQQLLALEDSFKLRFEVCFNQWKWSLPSKTPGIDKDEFDTDQTVYFLAYNGSDLVGCIRLNPTVSSHMMTEIFSSYCDLAPIPTGSDTLELSRYVIDRKKVNRRQLLEVMGELEYAVTQYCLKNGIVKVSWLTTKDVYSKNVSLWKTRPLGLPKKSPDTGEIYIAAVSAIEPSALERITSRYKLETAPEINIPTVSKRRQRSSEQYVAA